MAIKVVLFDVDGVLANGGPFSHCLERDYDITQQIVRPFFQGRFRECLVGNADLKEELAPLLHEWGWRGSVDDFLDYWFRSEHSINEPLMLEVQRLREHGLRCYIATDQEKYRTAYLLEHMGFANAFDGMFSSAHIGYIKHDTRFFQSVLQALQDIHANEILFWDDTAGKVETARSAGLQAEVYHDFADFTEKMERFIK
ncbi:haloacid dehalogenase [Reticulibacter mediterranei]|uniref:Haloacid dehalogenase n=1 Tax=Reticulibacter mediterranei TaxID=2778369 RepID=A0A8J3IXE9_9CHLR|nr:HAD family hydrolase [Reticulibacter mediterranei]GHO97831.1 haloacid dehalogenase [Reticulibacter mediterranei]